MRKGRQSSKPGASDPCCGGADAIRCLLPLLTVVAIALSAVAVVSCNFFYYSFNVVDDGTAWRFGDRIELAIGNAISNAFDSVTGNNNRSRNINFSAGLFSMSNGWECSTYCHDDDTDVDCLLSGFYDPDTGGPAVIAARYSSALALFFALSALLIASVGICCCRRNVGCKVFLSVLYVLAMIFQIGTFAMAITTTTDDGYWRSCFSEASALRCSMDTGSKVSVASIVSYFLLAGLACYASRRSRSRKDADDAERDTDDSDLEQQQNNNDDAAAAAAAVTAVTAEPEEKPERGVEKKSDETDDAADDAERDTDDSDLEQQNNNNAAAAATVTAEPEEKPERGVEEKSDETEDDATADEAAMQEKRDSVVENENENKDDERADKTGDESRSVDAEETSTGQGSDENETDAKPADGAAEATVDKTNEQAIAEEQDNGPIVPFGCVNC